MYDVITVGSATVDAFAYTERSKVIKVEKRAKEQDFIAYPSGTKILLNRLLFMTGGGGTNTAVAFSRLGLKTAFLGSIGSDGHGNAIVKELKNEKVDFIGQRSKKEASGFSIILDSIEHDRTILVFLGANKSLQLSDINMGKVTAKWFYFSSMVGKSYKAIEELSRHAKKNGINIAFNSGSYLVGKGKKYLSRVLFSTRILFLNKEEAEALVGNGDIPGMMQKLHKLGPEIITITNGREGAYASDGKSLYFAPAHKIKVVETTGAGDAFASGFLAGFIKKNDIKFGLKLGIANAESVLSYYGAKNRLLKWNKALSVLKRGNEKIKMKAL